MSCPSDFEIFAGMGAEVKDYIFSIAQVFRSARSKTLDRK
jgi:hypothetical protein